MVFPGGEERENTVTALNIVAPKPITVTSLNINQVDFTNWQ